MINQTILPNKIIIFVLINHTYCILYHRLKKDLSKGDYSPTLKKHLKLFSRTVSDSPRIYLDNTLDFINNANDQTDVIDTNK